MKTGIWSVLIILIVGAVALVVFRKEQSESPQGAANTQLTIAVIPKGTTHSYWNFVHAGADQAAKDLGVNIIFKGPLLEDDRAGQISLVEQFASGTVNGIVLAPLDDTALLPSVQSAMQKTPVVIVDSSLKGQVGKDFVCYVGTDNTAAGKIGGTELARLLGGKGKYVLLRYAVGSASTQQREDGFLSAMKENPGMVPLLSKEVYGGATVDQAQAASLNLLAQIKQADGIFCPNESTTQGMLNTLEQNNLVGKIHFVGFDTNPELIGALKKGEIDALVSQNPIKMGYEGVKACVDYIHGVAQQPVQDSGAQLITRDNLDTPEVQKLLSGG
jgi:ribose transport system substrate-binding protein